MPLIAPRCRACICCFRVNTGFCKSQCKTSRKKNDNLTTTQVAACETIQRMQKETDDLRKQLEIAQRINMQYKDLRTQLENAQLQNTQLVTARNSLSRQLQLAQNIVKNNNDLHKQLENEKLKNCELGQRFNGNVNG